MSGEVLASINYRRHNGKHQSSQDPDQNKWIQQVRTLVKDARQLSKPPSIQEMGFALRHQPTGMKREDFLNEGRVKEKYYPLCEEVVVAETGAAFVKCFHHLVRGKGTAKPFAGIAHCDYSVQTAFDLLSHVRPEGFDMRGFQGRICVMNVWRNINPNTPLLNHHLAMCDGSTIVSPDDFVYYDSLDEGKVSESFHMDPHNSKFHKWYYFPSQTADEALLFMQYDSDPRNPCRYTFHTSLTVNNDFLDFERESIEVRLLAFFPSEYNTLPDMTLPSQLRIPSAVDAIRTDFVHLHKWDDNGKQFIAKEAAVGNLRKIVKSHCDHHRREGLRGEFKDLTDDEIKQVQDACVSDGFLQRQISIALGIDVPNQYLRVPGAAKAIRQDFAHVGSWDVGGKTWVRNEASRGNIQGLVKNLCEHHRKEGKREEFKNLTDHEIKDVQAECLKDDYLAKTISKALGVTIP